MTIVKLPSICNFLISKKEVIIEANTLGQVFEILLLQYPALKPILEPTNKPKDFLSIFINGHCETPYNPLRKLAPTDKIEIMSPISGG